MQILAGGVHGGILTENNKVVELIGVQEKDLLLMVSALNVQGIKNKL